MKTPIFILFILLTLSCTQQPNTTATNNQNSTTNSTEPEFTINPVQATSLVILGTVQDAGSPHAGCKKKCCAKLFNQPVADRKVVSLGIVDPGSNTKYMLEATPDMREQMKMLKQYLPTNDKEVPDGIFITHAHIGHYTGLMYLGRESMNAKEVPVYVMPKMQKYLSTNGPWSQLVNINNISLKKLKHETPQQLNNQLSIIPFLVPHRDEYSETVGFKVIGPNKKALFIPDIDKWEKWDKDIIKEIEQVDYAFLDATFFDGDEIKNRDISEIPHPFIIESMSTFKNLPSKEKKKVYFIHLNHTNPALDVNHVKTKSVLKTGLNIARINQVFPL